MADEFLKLYPASTDEEAALANNAAARDNSRVSTYLWGTEWTRHSKRPVYTYFWTHRPPGPDHDRRGAYHGSEIAYVFDHLYPADRPWTDEDRRIADTVSSYWANYAATGNPNGPGLPAWPAYDPKSPTVMELGGGFKPIPVAEPDRLDFWKRFFKTQQAW
jgi:para-nitrobenzyl esterase